MISILVAKILRADNSTLPLLTRESGVVGSTKGELRWGTERIQLPWRAKDPTVVQCWTAAMLPTPSNALNIRVLRKNGSPLFSGCRVCS